MEKYKGLIIVTLIIAIIGLVLGGISMIKSKGGEWVCVAEKCEKTVTGDEWVEQNCHPEEGDMVCEFQYQGQNFKVPLSGVNSSSMESCSEYSCDSEVYIRRLG